ncbi:MAG: phosphoglycerate kinase [Thermodesulfobacteriota bacterium]
MKTIKDIDVAQKRVFLRVDFNVPLDPQGQVSDDARIQAALPTIAYAIEHGAKLIVASHLGRPKGKPVAAFSLKPAAERLSALLNRPVTLLDDCIGDSVKSSIDRMQPRDVVMLENLRFHPEEEKNDDAFGKALAELCDIYVNDAFAVSHRANASVEAMVRHAPVACAGFLLEKEMTYFRMALLDPKRPLVAIVGGAKVSSKIGLLKNLLDKVDKLLIGGAMANTFFRAIGYATGKSLVEEDRIDTAADVLKTARERGIPVYLPVDVVTAPRMEADAPIRHVPVQEIGAEDMALDVGPATCLLFAEALQDAATIVWNGPVGAFEIPAFSRGTLSLVDHVATSTAISIIGGGDTGAAVHLSGKSDRMTYISTGGGAFLELLEGKTLPGVAALESVS